MKRVFTFGVIFLLLVTSVYGLTWNHTRYVQNRAYIGSGSSYDPVYGFIRETGSMMTEQIGTGKVWYVDSGCSSTAATGQSWDVACLTLSAAIALSSADGGANRGDVIYVAQGHNEDGVVGTAALWQASVAGLRIKGIGRGSLMPIFDLNYTSNTCQITADNVELDNIWIRPSTDTITIGLEVTSGSDYSHIVNCKIGNAETATDECSIAIRVGTSTGAIVENCTINVGAQAAVTGITFDAATDLILRNNYLLGDFSTANINNAITLSENILIENNVLWNGVTSGLNAQPVIEILAGTIGNCRLNEAVANVANLPAAYVGNGLYYARNSYNESATSSYAAYVTDLAAASTPASVNPGHGE